MQNIFLNKKFWLNLLKIKEEEVPKTMIIYGSWFFDKTIKLLEKNITKKQDTGLPNLHIGKINNKSVAYGAVYGPTMAGEFTHLAGVIGIKRIILIGSCGSLQAGKNNIIIPKSSIRNDAVSDWYLSKNVTPLATIKLVNKAKQLLAKKNITSDIGTVITLSHMLMETNDLIDNWNKQGIDGVDLETASVYSIANFFNLECVALLIKSDQLVDTKIKPLTREKCLSIKENLISCAINLAY